MRIGPTKTKDDETKSIARTHVHLRRWRANIGVFRTRNSITWEDRLGKLLLPLDSRFADSETLLPFWEERALGILFKYRWARHRRIPRFVLLLFLLFFFFFSLIFSRFFLLPQLPSSSFFVVFSRSIYVLIFD